MGIKYWTRTTWESQLEPTRVEEKLHDKDIYNLIDFPCLLMMGEWYCFEGKFYVSYVHGQFESAEEVRETIGMGGLIREFSDQMREFVLSQVEIPQSDAMQ